MDYRAPEVLKELAPGKRPSIEDIIPLIQKERELFRTAAKFDLPAPSDLPTRAEMAKLPIAEQLRQQFNIMRLQDATINEQTRQIRMLLEHITGIYTLVDLVSHTVPGEGLVRRWTGAEIQDDTSESYKARSDLQKLLTIVSERTQHLIGLENRRKYLHARWERAVGVIHGWWQRLWWGR